MRRCHHGIAAECRVGCSITYNAAGQNTNTQFGQIMATRNPQYMQLGLRVTF
jgi:hypothetical protein